MKEHIKMVIAALEKAPAKYKVNGAEHILDALYQHYADNLKGDSASIMQQFQQLNDLLDAFSIREQDQVVDLVCGLCAAYQKEAYQDGLVAGFQLSRELSHNYD